MNVNSSSLAQMNYFQLQNNTSVQAQSAQSGFSPEVSANETNEGNDHDGDDGGSKALNSAQALSQLLNKQKNGIFPTSNQTAGLAKILSNQQNLQSALLKNIKSLYSSPANNYATNPLSALTGGINIKA
jgi:hypothetical protein